MTHYTAKTQPYQDSFCQKRHTKKAPHLRLTFEEIKARKNCMRCDQYLADLLASMKAIGWKFIIHDLPKFADEIGLSMRTFQRARKRLIEAGRLIENRINRDSVEFFLARDYDTPIAENDAPIALDDTPIALDDTPIALDDTPIAETPPKPAPIAEHSDSSDLFSDLFSDPLSIPPTTQDEREKLEIFENGKPIEPFKNWLIEQARKMPRAIGNVPVWVGAMARRSEWQEAFTEWHKQSTEIKYSAPLSPSTFIPIQIERSEQELSTLKESIANAKKLLRGAS